MNRVSIALIAGCLIASHLMGQDAGARGGDRTPYPSRPLVGRTNFNLQDLGVRQNLDGSACFPAPFYEYCKYGYNNYSALDLYHLWTYYSLWNGANEIAPPQPAYTIQAPEPPAPPPAPPATAVLKEYSWPEEVNAPAAFSIVTTDGTVYLATMIWVEGNAVHFNSLDGDVRQIPLTSVSRPLTETANARKSLKLRLPWTQAATSNIDAVPEAQVQAHPGGSDPFQL